MTTHLEGGCFVTDLGTGEPLRAGRVACWPLVGRHTGAVHISMRALEFAPGESPLLHAGDWEDIWFVAEGQGEVLLGGWWYSVRTGTGLHLAPGTTARVENAGPGRLVVLSCRCPDPGADLHVASEPASASDREAREIGAPEEQPIAPIVHLADRPAEHTDERWFRILVDRSVGCEQVTQFVGWIPPGRAPDHSHDYEEVLCILEGTGRMWAGSSHAPIGPGSCVYLPRGQLHCVENQGRGVLRLLGVFYPAGSPAARSGEPDPR